MSDVSNTEQTLSKVKIQFLIGAKTKSAFLATLLFGLKTEIGNACKTAATDGLTLFVNPSFFNKLPFPQQITLVAHEVYHVAFKHMLRLGNKQMRLWNIACDHVINLMLKKAGFTPIANWYCDSKYDGWSADEVYNDLIQNPPPVLPEEPDHLIKPSSDSNLRESSEEAITHQIDKLIAKAAVQSKMAKEYGNLPSDIQRVIEDITNPKLPWNTLLLNYVSTLSKNDYSYRKPNRKYLPDFYMPTLYSESLGALGIAFDASCSVTDEDFAIFKGESLLIEQLMNPSHVEVVSFDTKIQSRHILERGDSIADLEFKGRGGTSLRPVFEHFNKNPPELLIVFSDLECTPWVEPPPYPVIWVLVGHRTIPKVYFGTLIEYVK